MTLGPRNIALAILVAAGPGVLACAPSRSEGVRPATPLEAAVGIGMAADELANSKAREVVLGWNLEVVGERAHFYACTAEDTCGERFVEIPAAALLAVKVVGRATPTRDDGSTAGATDVLRLTIANDVSTSRGGIASDPHRGLTFGAARAK